MGNKRWDSRSKSQRRNSLEESKAKGAQKSLLIYLSIFVVVLVLLLVLVLGGG